MAKSDHNTWKKESGYIWSLVGSAVGFANLLGFSSQCYRNGGGAFLIPFICGLIVLGLPMMCLEGHIGQKFQLPLIAAYLKSSHKKYSKLFGWLSIITVGSIGSFYLVLTGWTLLYSVYEALGLIPQDTEYFFVHDFIIDSGKLNVLGKISWKSLLGLLASSLFAGYVVSKNIQSGIEKWCSLFLPMLAGLILVSFLFVIFLPGAWQGFYLYLKPDFSKLADPILWRDAFGHLFFSLSLGIGIIVGYSRHTHKKTSIPKAMVQVALADLIISFLSGFVIFGCLGYLSELQGKNIQDLIKTNSIFDLGYIVFPIIFNEIGGWIGRLAGTLFFFCLFIAGITGVFSIFESILGNISLEFNISRKKSAWITTALVCTFSFLFCFGNCLYLIDALTPMILGYSLLIGGLSQIYYFLYRSHQKFTFSKSELINKYIHINLRYLSPFIIVIILYGSIHYECSQIGSRSYIYGSILRLIWLTVAVSLSVWFTEVVHKKKKTHP